jgi:two-component system chemotaxis response regulator CheY
MYDQNTSIGINMGSKIDLKIKILVVDDFSTMRKLVRNVLKQIGFSNITEAEDGNMALEVMRNEEIGLVVTDWNMPNMTGIELLQRIRDDGKSKNIPVLMLTAEGKTENVVAAVKAGVDNFIVKPFTAEVMQAKIEQIFAKRSV